jgi:dTDP-4-dehydrorhamnose 3,5-epimerase
LKARPTTLPGVLVIEPDVFSDARGFFLETYREDRYRELGIHDRFVQDNLSRSERGVLRGLHFQNPRAQAKLATVLEGEVFDVAVDVRRGSPTFGRWFGTTLSETNKHQLYVPAGFAHGFCVLSERALFAYKCSDTYVPEADRCIRWDDPQLAIEWPVDAPSLSRKDADAPRLSELREDLLPTLVSG